MSFVNAWFVGRRRLHVGREYETISVRKYGIMSDKTIPRHLVESTTNDPLTAILLQDSALTRTQFETLLIASLRGRDHGEKLSKNEMIALRPRKRKLTRGAFNQTLNQAQTNVIRSIYTVLLLGYAGLFDSPQLEPFIEVANQLRSFIDAKTIDGTGNVSTEMEAATRLIAETIHATLRDLASKYSFKAKV